MAELKKQDYDLAFTHLRNNQNISAHNLFINLAESQKESDSIRAAILYLLAGECKTKQGKENNTEMLEAGKLFLDFGKKEKNYKAKGAYLCASKCFLKAGEYDDAKKAFDQAKEFHVPSIDISRPIVIIEDSKAIVLKLQNYLDSLGYKDYISFHSGKEGISSCRKLIEDSKNPIVLLDMGLPDVQGNEVASNLLQEKLDLQIILITADEKTSKRVSETISSGVAAFIQKPFTINDLKKALDIAEKEYSLS
ncbi:MAG TPA: response regulator [Nitrosopumilaceae archaeon]|nr:response regulator [Nitrosopumilaceae archaeon]